MNENSAFVSRYDHLVGERELGCFVFFFCFYFCFCFVLLLFFVICKSSVLSSSWCHWKGMIYDCGSFFALSLVLQMSATQR